MQEEDLKTALTGLAGRAEAAPGALERITAGRRRHEVRRRAMTATTAVAAVTALAFGAVQLLGTRSADRPPTFASDQPGPGGPPTSTPTPSPFEPFATDRVAFVATDGSLRVYDPATGEVRIAQEGRGEHRLPTFDGVTGELYAVAWDGARSTIWQIGDDDCPPQKACPSSDRQELAVKGRIDALAVLAGRVAFLSMDEPEGAEAFHRLWVLGDGTRDPAALWQFPPYLGRGVTSDDEVSVSFSPDGEQLLVVNTFVDTAEERQDETMLVFDLAGNLLLEPINGTHARWTDAGTLLYKPLSPPDDNRWRELDPTTGDVRELPIDVAGATNPVLSADGSKLAVENEGTNSIIVLDLATGATEIVPGAAPIWLDGETLLVTEVEECEPDLCEVQPYRDTGRVLRITVGELIGEPVPIATTRGAAFRANWGEPLELEPGS